MKKILLLALFSVLMSGMSVSYAEPERIEIKNRQKLTQEKVARTQIKNIDLQDIEDPAARRAIQQILVYLGLEAQR